MDCPMEETLDEFVTELSLRGVTDVVRVCEPTYNTEKLTVAGIKVHDWAFADGGIPPDKVLADMIQLCESRFTNLLLTSKVIAEKTTDDSSGPVIAVHCVAGLGRAPVLVAVALIEAGLQPLDAVEFIRKCRRGALNSTQLQFLVDTYKKRSAVRKIGFFGKRAPSPPSPKKDESIKSKFIKALKSGLVKT